MFSYRHLYKNVHTSAFHFIFEICGILIFQYLHFNTECMQHSFYNTLARFFFLQKGKNVLSTQWSA